MDASPARLFRRGGRALLRHERRPTIDAITQFQLANGPFPPDGQASVALGISYGANAAPYTMVRLNFAIRQVPLHRLAALNQMPNRIMAPQVFRRPAELLGNRSDGG
jgi:hypothetical protein